MSRIRTLLALSLVFGVAACGGPGENAQAPEAQPAGATFVEHGEWVIHFNAQSTDQLTEEIASIYDITRSACRAMMTLSVLRQDDNTPVRATVEGRAVNLTGQLKPLVVREIEEQEAIYYIGFQSGGSPVRNLETLRFEFVVTPEGSTEAIDVVFIRQFYNDC